MMQKSLIKIIGSGITGLTTALCLLENGFQVRILTKQLYPQTVSSVAAAIWFPYAVEPKDQVNQWSFLTYQFLEELAKEEGSGVSMIPFLVLSAPGREEDWLEGLPQEAVREASRSELPKGYERGYWAQVPLADTNIYLPYLVWRISNLGGEIIQHTISREELEKDSLQLYINCTGLGAREIFTDEELKPMRGQVLKVNKGFPAISMVDSMHPGQLSYVIERKHDYVLGGTDYVNDDDESARAEDTKMIIERCQRLQPIPEQLSIKQVAVGLRPKRDRIRCEWDDELLNVIHNYGHGGAGYTVSWGCALHVLHLLTSK